MNPPVPFQRGRTIGLSLPRRFIGDLLAFAQRVPTVPMQRRMQLADVIAARKAWPEHISWCAIFIKAYAIVSQRRPELRRAFLTFPWSRLYEHPQNVASFSLERNYQGEESVFYGKIAAPESLSLVQLNAIVRHYKTAPLESIPSFQQALLLSRFPQFIRRFIWWLGLCTDGSYRAYFFGTFGISVVAQLGAAGVHILSPLTTTLNYGTFEPDGALEVRLVYDHRVFDGATVARAIAALEEVLHHEILAELQAGPPPASEPSTTAPPATAEPALALS